MADAPVVEHVPFLPFLYRIPAALSRLGFVAFERAARAAGAAVRGVSVGIDRVGHGLVVAGSI